MVKLSSNPVGLLHCVLSYKRGPLLQELQTPFFSKLPCSPPLLILAEGIVEGSSMSISIVPFSQ